MHKENAAALLPIGVFLLLYLGLGILLEYVLKIPMGFYNIPIVVCFLVAIMVAFMQNRSLNIDKKLAVMAQGVGDKNIITMVLIFMTAGIFVGVVGRSGAESVAYCMLSLIPPQFSVMVLFIVSCFVSLSMGTSCGTITLITPIAAAVASTSGFSLPLCVGSVIGGAMFGDNLSFISDTTIAVCNGQGCKLKDKFIANFKLAITAAIITLVIIGAQSLNDINGAIEIPDYSFIQIIPYILVLAGGLIGMNVFIVLLVGIISGALITLGTGAIDPIALLGNMGKGVSGMFETSMVAVLVAALCSLINVYGGFDAILNGIRNTFNSKKGGCLGVAMLVGLMDIATANNTVAIVMANPIAKRISEEYNISSKETASLLDTWSCIFQGIIPYGAQMLIALAAVHTLGYTITAFDILPAMYYPYILGLVCLAYIFFFMNKEN